MCEADKQIFQSFAQAQVSVTNEVYEHLNQPTFLFCPTEYCASRAVPSVSQSDYLATIGARLLPGIDIMWTGPRVISKRITIKSIEELTEVLKRPPIIWDNIHANDYDPRRLFLGPYNGRSPELIPYLRGVMTNPNCEFESNFIAMHTLAQWSKSNLGGVKKDCPSDSPSPITADIRLETDGDYSSDDDIPSPNACYLPCNALLSALIDWTEELYQDNKALNFKERWVAPTVTITNMVPTVTTCSTVTVTTTTTQVMNSTELTIPEEGCNKNLNTLVMDPTGGSYMQPVMTVNTVNSLLDSQLCSDSDSDIASNDSDIASILAVPGVEESVGMAIEPMDCSVTPSSSPPLSSSILEDSYSPNVCDPTLNVPVMNDINSSDVCTCGSSMVENMQDICQTCNSGAILTKLDTLSQVSILDSSSLALCSRLTHEELCLLVDFFYLPYEHGSRALKLLMNFHWLKTNAHHVHEAQLQNASENQKELSVQWLEKQGQFETVVQEIFLMYNKVLLLPNQVFVQEVLSYMWDIKVVLGHALTFTQWLAMGRINLYGVMNMAGNPYTWANSVYKEAFSNGEQEPWMFRGGFSAEFHRMLPLEGAGDLMLLATPEVHDLTMYTVRPYKPSDEVKVYEICRKTCDDGMDGTDIFPEDPELLGDRLVGAFLTLSPEFCFVLEDSQGQVVGYALSTLDAAEFHKRADIAYIPAMQEKYPKPQRTEGLSPAEEMINTFYETRAPLSAQLQQSQPTLVRVDILPEHRDANTAGKVVLGAVSLAIKACASNGMHTEINIGDKCAKDFYSSLSFFELNALPESASEELVYMGRAI
eukprot:GHVU01081099.1.p1 GENE.GHVU01081099.1~~GHVU01081099.1.p1  ORF type:complete len:921 (+),score=115.42 GHVU01081099.1:309-2765(+)